jgi:hypothetical protein
LFSLETHVTKTSSMFHDPQIRKDVVTGLAMRLTRDSLSADEFRRELNALTHQECSCLVEFLRAQGPLEPHPPGTSRETVA